nr:MND1-interacting protein 1-like [Ipomoea batatas]
MGCNVREKHIRANRRNRSAKPDPEQGSSNNNTGNAVERTPLSKSIMESGIKPLNCFMGSHDSALSTNPSPTPGGGFDSNGWGYCTEEQLEDLVMKNLEFLYNEAIVKLVSLGYDEDVALKAILKNGFCYGGMDVLNNILHNAISYLKSGTSSEESENNFTDLRQMQEYSLAGMVCILQQVKPQFSKGDAMWCLLMSDLNVGRASVMDIPVLPQPNGNGSASVSVTAMQAARKLSNDLTELKMLRMEREETQSVKKGKQTIEDNTMKKLTEMENALRKASGEVDRANSAVKKLETENAEIRAEMEACKLSASESATTFMEERWTKEQAAKEVALTQVEEERRLKEATEAGNKRKLEALRLKIEIDFQRQKDDLQRLQQDLSRLKSSELSAEQHHQSVRLTTGNSDGVNAHGDIARLLHELDNLENSAEKEVGCDRECILCLKDEVSVVFLPCAHQVVCANCNESYGKKGRAACPACRVPIEQRIRVFGATS